MGHGEVADIVELLRVPEVVYQAEDASPVAVVAGGMLCEGLCDLIAEPVVIPRVCDLVVWD